MPFHIFSCGYAVSNNDKPRQQTNFQKGNETIMNYDEAPLMPVGLQSQKENLQVNDANLQNLYRKIEEFENNGQMVPPVLLQEIQRLESKRRHVEQDESQPTPQQDQSCNYCTGEEEPLLPADVERSKN